MKEVFGDALSLRKEYTYLAVTTNGFVKNNGEAVMGAGIAKRINLYGLAHGVNMAKILGEMITKNGNVTQKLCTNIISFPVKHNWFEKADIDLIVRSIQQLKSLLAPGETVLLPRPGCGNGKLSWEHQVKPAIAPHLNEQITIVHWAEIKEKKRGI